MKVSVYSTTTCPYCVMVKRWLDSQGVEYEDVLVDKDPKAAQQMVKLSNQMSVPFTWIVGDDGNGRGVLGYDVPTLSNLLGDLNPPNTARKNPTEKVRSMRGRG